jgi:hypothetical protein
MYLLSIHGCSDRFMLKCRCTFFSLVLLFFSVLAAPHTSAACPSFIGAEIGILNKGTTNPTLACAAKPMFKAGPIPERALFAV